jgi:hypothetical protein
MKGWNYWNPIKYDVHPCLNNKVNLSTICRGFTFAATIEYNKNMLLMLFVTRTLM